MPYADPAKKAEWQRQRRKNSPELVRRQNLKSKYGLTIEEYDALLEDQQGVCAICDTPPEKERLDVDHDHADGRIRGLLCRRCNLLLGKVYDDAELLRKAAEYLGR